MRRAPRLLLAVLLLGTVLRLVHYVLGRSLWLDEARLALDIASLSWTGLLKPLPYDQAGPPLFLWGVKALTAGFGVNEWTLRAIPVAAGIGVVWLIYPVARRFVSAPAATVAAAIVAFSPSLIFFSNEVKPYSTDALATLVLLALAAAWHEQPEDTRRWALLTVAGAIAVWLSVPAVLVLAGIGCASLLHEAIRSRRFVRLLASGAAWVLSFLTAYLLVYQPASRSPYLREYWAPALLVPGTPDLARRAWLVLRALVWGIPFGHPGPIYASPIELLLMSPMTVLVAIVMGLGVARLLREGKARAALALAPLAVMLAATVVGAYPLALRLSLFTAGLLVILVVAGIEWLATDVRATRRSLVGGAVAGLLLALPVTHAIPDLIRWPAPQHARPLIQRYEAAGGGEPIYVHPGALPAWAFYTTDWAAPDTARLAFLSRIGSSGGAAFENAPRRGAVVEEGAARTYRGRKEIFGVPVGLQLHAFVGRTKALPDSGWTEHEIRRIRSEADSAVWLLFAHLSGQGPEMEFLEEIRGKAISEARWYERGVGLMRFQLR
jgi:hypothetical protein